MQRLTADKKSGGQGDFCMRVFNLETCTARPYGQIIPGLVL
ncbi:hypothetical protein [Pedobacter cryoconitis]|uniref:Uncharacterized protein n=1 Tax=Pedobacter cryoconitis TaxID=188932 RepID=A0A7X0J1R2_9SPHI|nr:hypothetical protein [Pedobacter cryoconitis]MBB6499335.1 hypothetical protein [Pedobacter cryoconitis]